MNDLISRQAAINAADRADYAGLAVEEVKKVTDEVVKELKQIPIADAVEVVHGEWLEDSEGEIYCSKCGKYTYDRHDEIKQFNGTQVIALCYPRFCGNCGADMRGKTDGKDKQ